MMVSSTDGKEDEMTQHRNYDLLLMDADGTLFDYERAEQYALTSALRDFGLISGLDSLIQDYQRINAQLWADLEQGKISKDALRTERFHLLFRQHSLTVDAHAFSTCYLDYLAHSSFLIEGAEAICRYLSERATLIIVTNGIQEVQLTRLAGASIKPYIRGIVVSEEVGVGKPEPAIFTYALAQANHSDKARVLMVGDSLSADILGGIRFGIDTCWVNLKGEAGNDAIRPTYEVNDLYALKQIIR